LALGSFGYYYYFRDFHLLSIGELNVDQTKDYADDFGS
jgi:hypothetical protein